MRRKVRSMCEIRKDEARKQLGENRPEEEEESLNDKWLVIRLSQTLHGEGLVLVASLQ
jgi:hypothetical protein